MRMRTLWIGALTALSLGLTGCDFGDVEQGRCVAFNPESKEVTVVLDTQHNEQHPQYTGGVHVYLLPSDPAEIGPLPKAGRCVDVNPKAETVTIYNPDTKALETLSVKFTDVEEGIGSKHPKVAGKTFPIIDQEKSSVTVYVPPRKLLVTFTPPTEAMTLPAETWAKGDEVRIYYKENAKHQALRFMNVTQTNLFKK